ncbi:MAG: helix-turn-helix domain-containing protein [Acidimicrobiia bacterium]
MAEQLLTVQEIASAMRVSEMTVYRLIRDGRLGAVRIGKHLRVSREEFHAFLDSNAVIATPAAVTS